ncbi:MAG: glycoside hydrolase family 13 protein [Chloroflexota bacterium]
MSAGAPAWVRDAVFYQVFPDRFAASTRVPKPGPLEPWDAPPTIHGYKGGDLLGLVERLHDLEDLGINAIYLNPVFTAASNHRYNAYDYLAVDPLLGGEAALRELLDAAHGRGIRVILDGVFNHVGRGWWPFHHVLEAGGASPYRDWFFLDQGVVEGHERLTAYGEGAPRGYRAWWGSPGLPKLRVDHPEVRAHLMAVAEHWIRFGIDGWRLDVPQDIEDPTFWPEFRRRVRALNPEAYLLGEIWEEAPEWVAGDRFDAVMNYPLGIAILGFVGAGAIDHTIIERQSNYRRELRPLDGPGFAAVLDRQRHAYPPDVAAVQFNLIGSHDTPRAVTVMGGDAARLRLAAVLQLTLPGAPSIYYGDELAMAGPADPGCRGAYPPAGASLGAEAVATLACVRAMIRARRDHPALRLGEVEVLATGDRWVLLSRRAGSARAIVAVNAGDAPVGIGLFPETAAGLARVDVPGVGGGSVSADGMSLTLEPWGAIILVAR